MSVQVTATALLHVTQRSVFHLCSVCSAPPPIPATTHPTLLIFDNNIGRPGARGRVRSARIKLIGSALAIVGTDRSPPTEQTSRAHASQRARVLA